MEIYLRFLSLFWAPTLPSLVWVFLKPTCRLFVCTAIRSAHDRAWAPVLLFDSEQYEAAPLVAFNNVLGSIFTSEIQLFDFDVRCLLGLAWRLGCACALAFLVRVGSGAGISYGFAGLGAIWLRVLGFGSWGTLRGSGWSRLSESRFLDRFLLMTSLWKTNSNLSSQRFQRLRSSFWE